MSDESQNMSTKELSRGIERFEDLIAWQKSRTLVREIYKATRNSSSCCDPRLIWQLQSAAVSTMANVAEGYERATPGAFHHFLGVAKASCAEVRSHLYVALDTGSLDKKEAERLLQSAEEVGRIIGGLRIAVAKRRQ